MPKQHNDHKMLLECASGGPPVAPGIVRKSMELAARDLQRDFRAQASAELARWKSQQMMGEAMLKSLIRSDPSFERVAQRLVKAAAIEKKTVAGRKGRLEVPRLADVESRVFTGSIGGVQTPAYHYDWNWHASTGHVDSMRKNASAAAGTLDMYTYLGGGQGAASIDLRTAVGFYLRPLTDTGLLRVDTAPGYNVDLSTFSAFGSSVTSAWLGMFIGEYTVSSNTYLGARVSTQNSLGSVDTWWGGSRHRASSSGYSMSSTIAVSSAHWYAIWVWGGIRGSVGGDGWFSNTGVISSLAVNVPSFLWTLY